MKHKNHCKSVCWLPALTVLFILAVIPYMHANEVEAKPINSDIEKANRELGIMARVLEASLDRSGLAPWLPVAAGTSAFDPGIKVQYIPKVCATFTIPVNFPIFDPAKQPEQKEAPGQEKPDDLWEKYALEGDQTRELKVRRPYSRLAQLEGAIELRSVDEETKRKELFKWGEEHKQRLRDVLLETLAHYGHRLEHLNTNEEKIVFMVQAPMVQAPSDLSDPLVATYLNFLMAQRLNNERKILVAGKSLSLGQVNHYILVISNAKLNAAVILEDLESSVAIEEYYY